MPIEMDAPEESTAASPSELMDQPEAIEEEGAPAGSSKVPVLPSDDARRQHELTHLPYRTWCQACVLGRARENPHRQLIREDSVPVIQLDY